MFVGNLNRDITQQAVVSYFEASCGSVEGIHMPPVNVSYIVLIVARICVCSNVYVVMNVAM